MTELIHSSNFELLIAVMLSARCTDVSVNKVTKTLFKYINTPEAFIKLGENKLRKKINTIGLYNAKTKNIIRTCKILVEKYNSSVPNTREDLESLPGVGRKTANVVLNEAFGQPTIAVDTHVLRVANRIGLANSNSPLKVEEQLNKVVPNKYKLYAHSLLIAHGRTVCTARKPKCEQCVIKHLCRYYERGNYAFCYN